jgi:ketosteroid isomerase-like protein
METMELIQKLYDSFDQRDGDAMAQCYAPSATFTDPGFGELHGEEIGGMWRMLCATNSQLTVSVSHIVTDDASGSANWEARYLFDPKKKSIINKISATYRFEDGLIVEHIDDFSFHTWAKQALGLVGMLLGGTSFLQDQVRSQARRRLDSFMAS